MVVLFLSEATGIVDVGHVVLGLFQDEFGGSELRGAGLGAFD